MTTRELELKTRDEKVHEDCGCGCGCDCCTEAVGQREAVAVERASECGPDCDCSVEETKGTASQTPRAGS